MTLLRNRGFFMRALGDPSCNASFEYPAMSFEYSGMQDVVSSKADFLNLIRHYTVLSRKPDAKFTITKLFPGVYSISLKEGVQFVDLNFAPASPVSPTITPEVVEESEEDLDYIYQGLDTQMTFGVEFEFISKRNTNWFNSVKRAVGESKYELITTCHGSNSKWSFQYDTTPRPTNAQVTEGYTRGQELSTPIMKTKNDLKKLKEVMSLINSNATVNKTCGLHIHIGFSRRRSFPSNTDRQLHSFYYRNQDLIDKLLPKSRRTGNCYCNNLKHYFISSEKYSKISFRNYHKVGRTVEFRQAAGTTNFEKTGNWLIFIQGIVKLSLANSCKVYTNINNLIEDACPNSKSAEYMKNRVLQLA